MNLSGIFDAVDASIESNESSGNYVTLYDGRVTQIKNGICYVNKNGSSVKCYAKNISNISVNNLVHVIEKNNAKTEKDRIVLEGYFTDIGSISVRWSDITGKPNTYTPSLHIHSISDVTGLQESIPTKTSDLTNDSNFISSIPDEYITETELTNKGYMTSYTETDPTVPSWAKQSTKPSYTASEVGADASGSAQAVQDNLESHLDDSVSHLSSTEHTNLTDVISKKHSHSNKSVLDGITSTLITSWNSAVTHISDTVKHITNDERILWNTVGNKVDVITGKSLSANDLTDTLKSNYDSAWAHSISSHAPSNAEKNIVVGVQKNGTDLSVNATTRKVNVTVPTKMSELTNDTGYKTTDNNTLYSLTKSGSTINLVGSNGTTTSVDDENTQYTAGDGISINGTEISSDDGITQELIDQSWDEIIGAPGVLQSSYVFDTTAPSTKTKNMVFIKNNTGGTS